MQNMHVFAPTWPKCLSFTVKAYEVYPDYQMKYKYEEKYYI